MDKSISYVPVVLIGATATSVGIACTFKEGALILEKSCLLGKEYVDSYDMTISSYEIINEETQKIVDRLYCTQAIQQEKIFLPAVSAVLFEKVREHGIQCLFKTILIDVIKEEQGYLLTYYNVSGISQVRTKMLIDTTVICESKSKDYSRIKSKFLNALLVSDNYENNIDEYENSDILLEKGFYSNELCMKMKLKPETEWVEAREKMFQYWMRREPWMRNWKIASIASEFQIRPIKEMEELEERWLWIPSSAEKGILEGFDQGISKGKNLEVA